MKLDTEYEEVRNSPLYQLDSSAKGVHRVLFNVSRSGTGKGIQIGWAR
jgi:hypothetical protein